MIVSTNFHAPLIRVLLPHALAINSLFFLPPNQDIKPPGMTQFTNLTVILFHI
ncbi:conserved domain protein [delta proteobacterium NaphS2]|nr:conserved domain protein [delta proteobacterium NaphS2]